MLDELKEWTVHYLRNKDVLTKNIEKIEENKEGWDLIIKQKSGDRYCLIMPEIKDIDKVIEKLDSLNVLLVVLNTKKNLDAVINSWKSLVDHPKFCIMFVNPDSELEKKWIIYPHTHHKITEKGSLKKGLKSLFLTVESVR